MGSPAMGVLGIKTAAALVFFVFAITIWPSIKWVQMTVQELLHMGFMTYNEATECKRVRQGTDHPAGNPTRANLILPHASLHVVLVTMKWRLVSLKQPAYNM